MVFQPKPKSAAPEKKEEKKEENKEESAAPAAAADSKPAESKQVQVVITPVYLKQK